MNTNFNGELGHPDRPTDRPGYVPHLGGGASITGQSFYSCDLALLRNRRPNTEVVSRTVWGVSVGVRLDEKYSAVAGLVHAFGSWQRCV